MKLSDYFFSSGKRSSSLRLGIPVGIAAWLILRDWRYGLLFGAGATLLFSLILPLIAYRADLPYNRIKETLAQPFLFDERVRFTVQNGTVGGYFILTEQSMVLLSMERGTHQLELKREDIQSVALGENLCLNIFLPDNKFIRVISGVCYEMLEILRENGWNVSE